MVVLRLFLMTVFILLLGISTSSAQIVHRDEIHNFAGILEVEHTGPRWDEWELVGPTFESWDTQVDTWSIFSWKKYRKEYPGRFICCIESYIDVPQPLDNTDLFLIPLNDKFGHERQFRVLTFWESLGDSLHLRKIMPKVYLGRLGGLRVVGQAAPRDGAAIVVVENYTSGEGDHVGEYEFLLLNTVTLETELLYADSFNYEYGGQCDTLSFHLFENDEGLQAELIKEEIVFKLSDNESQSLEPVTVRADTTYVQLTK